jgi:hypothetical protein
MRRTRCAEPTSFGVVLEAEHDFRSTIPPSSNVLGHVAGVLLGVDGEAAGEAKVADLELAVGVDQEVSRLQVAVEDVGGVDVLESAEDLVDEGLEVGVGERLAGPDDGGEIALHQFWDLVLAGCSSAEIWILDLNRIDTRVKGAGEKLTFIEVCLVELVGARDVHVIETGNLGRPSQLMFSVVFQTHGTIDTAGDLVRTRSSWVLRRFGQAYVAVSSKVLKELDFTQRAFRKDLLAEYIGDLFDGNALVRFVVHSSALGIIVLARNRKPERGREREGRTTARQGNDARDVTWRHNAAWHIPHDPVGALAQLLGDSVPLIDNELLVEDLEDLASLEVGHDDDGGEGGARRGSAPDQTREAFDL